MSDQRDQREDQDRRDEEEDRVPDLEEAIAVYSADGQADDESGNDAGAEELRDPDHPRDPGRTGMPHGPDAL